MTQQPTWKLVANLGDVSPLEYGGLFVYVDETGVYPPEAERVEVLENEKGEVYWTIHRFILEPCTYIDGILSDNKFHPDYEVWFANRLPQIAKYFGNTEEEMRALFLSENPFERAVAWDAVGSYFGLDNLDSYPLTFETRAELEARYPQFA